jgi:2-(1,2-epoxy-1,2-dihydrophenyl)acetyl-CoA isomerase
MADLLIDRDTRITTITLNRPDALNSFDGRLAADLGDAVRDAARDADCRVIVLTGAGRAFCAGADLGYLTELIETQNWAKAAELVGSGAGAVAAIASAPKPVIAAVNGAAAGGGANLALACDIRIASERASIGQVFNRIGLHPDLGGTYFLPRLVGLGKAMELVFTADMVDAAEGHRLGLFNHVVPPDALMSDTRALAERLADKPPLAMARAKQALYRGSQATLDEMLAVELENQLALFSTQDAREGIKAFVEKRVPRFRGE